MPAFPRATDYVAKAAELQRYWSLRNTKFQDWYKQLRLDNNLKSANMESFIANDPRTLYNLALYLLTPSVIPHQIPAEGATPAQAISIAAVEQFFTEGWNNLNRDSRRRAQQAWLPYLIKLMLATGWFAVFAMATDEGLIADIWNPAEVFPEYADGLSCVVHTYKLSAAATRRKANQQGWSLQLPRGAISATITDIWVLDDQGIPENTILVNNKFVKPPTSHPELEAIPVFVGPVGGLPDMGSIVDDETWKEHLGESIVATNSEVYGNYNKQLTFLQQILRDTAQPRFKERSRSGRVLTPENIFKRGAIFKMDPDEDVGVIDMPSIPVELRTQLFDIQGMIQRGGFPWALYGNVSGDIAAFVMGQIAAAANQILQPYRDCTSSLLTDIDNLWYRQIRDGGVRVKDFQLPTDMPLNAAFQVELKVQIPGDLSLRASTARQLDPQFTLSQSTTLELLFPEVRDPIRERANIQRDMAMLNPVTAQIGLVAALREQADAADAAGIPDLARLFTSAANQVEAQIAQATQPATTPRQLGPSGPGVNLLPQQV